MSIAALIRDMSAAGAPAEAIAIAVEAIEAAQNEVAERREKVAARKRAERERARQSRDSHATVTPQNPAPSFPPDPPNTPTPVDNNTRARGARLADDFEAPKDWIEWAVAERNWSESDARSEAENFRDYWHAKPGKDGRKLDWPATWRNWVRNSRRATGSSARDGPGSSPSYAAMILQQERQRAQA